MDASSSANALEVVKALFASLETGELQEALTMVHPDARWSPIGLEEFGNKTGQICFEVRDIFRLHEWVVALGTIDDNRRNLGEIHAAAWNLKVANGLVLEAHGFETWSRALEMAGGWDDTKPAVDGEASVVPVRKTERRPPSLTQGHPHRAPSQPSV